MKTGNRKTKGCSRRFSGLEEIDRALSENRLLAFRCAKTWADPVGRLGLLLFAIAMAAFAIFVLIEDGIIGLTIS